MIKRNRDKNFGRVRSRRIPQWCAAAARRIESKNCTAIPAWAEFPNQLYVSDYHSELFAIVQSAEVCPNTYGHPQHSHSMRAKRVIWG
jgi:hypothetical protein